MANQALLNQVQSTIDIVQLTHVLIDHGILDDLENILNHDYDIIYSVETHNDEKQIEAVDYDNNPIDFNDLKDFILTIIQQH